MYIFFIGGSAVSGAESRLLATASLTAERLNAPVEIVMTRTLHSAMLRRIEKGSIRPLSEKIKLNIIANERFGIRHWMFHLTSLVWLNLRFLFKKIECSHFIISSPARFPAALLSKRILFEVTSPDVARSDIVRNMVRRLPQIEFVCVSENVCRVLKQEFETVPDEKLHVRLKPYCQMAPVAGLLEKKSNRVIFAHRLVERKNPRLAVAAFRILSQKYPKWTFEVYGEGPLRETLSAEMSIDKPANLIDGGHTNALKEIMMNARIFVSLIEPDNYPSQSILEAACFANALVLSDTGVSKEKFIDGNGHAVPLNCDAVVDAISELIESPNLDAVCLASQEIVKARYSINEYMNEHLRILCGELQTKHTIGANSAA